LTASARSGNLIAGDGTKNGPFPLRTKNQQKPQTNSLTGKAPYKFESISLQRRVERTAHTITRPEDGHQSPRVVRKDHTKDIDLSDTDYPASAR
jgi:hypothetical protein